MDKLPNIEEMRITRPFDTELHEPTSILPGAVGAITFAPNKDAPTYCAGCILLQAEVERLRAGNRKLLDENNELKRLLRVRTK